VDNLIGSSLLQFTTGILFFNFAAYLVLVLFLISIFHCILHGVIHRILDGSIFKKKKVAKDDLNGNYAKLFNQKYYALETLFPFAFISIVCTLIPNWIGQIFFIGNIFVSLGDIYGLFEANIGIGKNQIKTDDFSNNDIIEINI
jgi:hypothetical protein